MDQEAYDSLTPTERKVLRLVTRERKTEVVAGMLGVAASTVETHIKRARSKLGGVDRFAAADAVRRFEGCPQPLGTGGLGMGEPVPTPPVIGTGRAVSAPDAVGLREERATFRFPLQEPVELRGGRHLEANPAHILTAIVVIALAIVALIILAGLYGGTIQGGVNLIFPERTIH